MQARAVTGAGVVLATLLGLFVVAVLTAGSAMAHASLVGSDPADGGTIAADTEQVSLTFSEDINPDLAIVTLTGSDGAQAELEAPLVDGAEVVQSLPALAAGAVTVAYRVVSADGHPVQGTLSVTVEGPAPGSAAAGSAAAEPVTPTAAVSDVGSSSNGWWIGATVAGVVVLGGLLWWRRPS